MKRHTFAAATAAATIIAAGVGLQATSPAHAAPHAAMPAPASSSSTTGKPTTSRSTASAGGLAVVAMPGQRSDTVRALQVHLAQLGYFHAQPTGYYGPLTTAAVLQFQRQHGLEYRGIDTMATEVALHAELVKAQHQGWVNSARRTGATVQLGVTRSFPCLTGDHVSPCGSVDPADDVADLPIGKVTLQTVRGATVRFLTASGSLGRPVALASAIDARGHLHAPHFGGSAPLMSYTLDRAGHVTSLVQQYRP